MKIKGFDLGYCSNMHPGNTWNEIFHSLKTHTPSIKNSISPNNLYGIGLRLSFESSQELLKEHNMKEFQTWLSDNDCYVYTINGFVYGDFYNSPIKEKVYEPNWNEASRVSYTKNLIEILRLLSPQNSETGISVSPIAYKFHKDSLKDKSELYKKSCIALAELSHSLHQIDIQEQKDIHIDIEPEPDCCLEVTEDVVDFFQNHLWKKGKNYLVTHYGYSDDDAINILKRHICICYDVCHFAVKFEKQQYALEKIHESGIRIGKIQISSALKLTLDQNEEPIKNLLAFDEPLYLHQTSIFSGQILNTYTDLNELPTSFNQFPVELRTHYHVPVFLDHYGALSSTQDEILDVLKWLLNNPITSHLEIETYTWSILPETLKLDSIENILRELSWVSSNLR